MFPQLLIALINIAVSHDVERRPHQSKQSCVEVDCAVRVESHVHRDESLAGHSVGAQLSKPERRRDLPQQGHHVHVLDPTLGVRIVLRPESDELPQVVGAQDGPVPRQVVEVVHDDGHEEVEDEEGTEDEEADEVNVGKVGAAPRLGSSIVRLEIEIFLTFARCLGEAGLNSLYCILFIVSLN